MIYGLVGKPDRFKYFMHFNFILLLSSSWSHLSRPTQLASSHRILRRNRTIKKKKTVIKSSSYNCNNVTLATVTHKRCTADAIDFSAPSHSLTPDVSASPSSIRFGLCVRECASFTPFGLFSIAVADLYNPIIRRFQLKPISQC